MKVFQALAIVVILIVAPLGSYLFLKGGFVYRMDSVQQLLPKDTSTAEKALIDSLRTRSTKVKLVYTSKNDNPQKQRLLKKIDDRIVDREYFEIISFGDKPMEHPTDKIMYYSTMKDIIKDLENEYYLIDTLGRLRYKYDFTTGIDDSLIRHLSVVIPMEKRRTIQLNRDVITNQ